MCENPKCSGAAGSSTGLCPVCSRQQLEYIAEGLAPGAALSEEEVEERGYFWDRTETDESEPPRRQAKKR